MTRKYRWCQRLTSLRKMLTWGEPTEVFFLYVKHLEPETTLILIYHFWLVLPIKTRNQNTIYQTPILICHSWLVFPIKTRNPKIICQNQISVCNLSFLTCFANQNHNYCSNLFFCHLWLILQNKTSNMFLIFSICFYFVIFLLFW